MATGASAKFAARDAVADAGGEEQDPSATAHSMMFIGDIDEEDYSEILSRARTSDNRAGGNGNAATGSAQEPSGGEEKHDEDSRGPFDYQVDASDASAVPHADDDGDSAHDRFERRLKQKMDEGAKGRVPRHPPPADSDQGACSDEVKAPRRPHGRPEIIHEDCPPVPHPQIEAGTAQKGKPAKERGGVEIIEDEEPAPNFPPPSNVGDAAADGRAAEKEPLDNAYFFLRYLLWVITGIPPPPIEEANEDRLPAAIPARSTQNDAEGSMEPQHHVLEARLVDEEAPEFVVTYTYQPTDATASTPVYDAYPMGEEGGEEGSKEEEEPSPLPCWKRYQRSACVGRALVLFALAVGIAMGLTINKQSAPDSELEEVQKNPQSPTNSTAQNVMACVCSLAQDDLGDSLFQLEGSHRCQDDDSLSYEQAQRAPPFSMCVYPRSLDSGAESFDIEEFYMRHIESDTLWDANLTTSVGINESYLVMEDGSLKTVVLTPLSSVTENFSVINTPASFGGTLEVAGEVSFAGGSGDAIPAPQTRQLTTADTATFQLLIDLLPSSTINPGNGPSKTPSLQPVATGPTANPAFPSLAPQPPSNSPPASPVKSDSSDGDSDPPCANTIGFVDIYGDGCGYYEADANYPLFCDSYGANGPAGITPNEHCCVCKEALEAKGPTGAIATLKPAGEPTASKPTALLTPPPSREPSAQPAKQFILLGGTTSPSARPTGEPSNRPTDQPTKAPTNKPTAFPSARPTGEPSNQPTERPSSKPTAPPAPGPTPPGQPTNEPTSKPTAFPSARPTREPSDQPTKGPSSKPTAPPTRNPTREPSDQPTAEPTSKPAASPSARPTSKPTDQPTKQPIDANPPTSPTQKPTDIPTPAPSNKPTGVPTGKPTNQPTKLPIEASGPTPAPSKKSTNIPTRSPTPIPTLEPSAKPSLPPTKEPTNIPTQIPTQTPTQTPTDSPTRAPSKKPTNNPTSKPTQQPTLKPTLSPTKKPTADPTQKPTLQPTKAPTPKPTLKAFTDKAELQTAVNACASPSAQTGAACESAKSTYGWPMGTWQVGAVTDMSKLFEGKADFNEDISSWDVSQVTNMFNTFFEATSFNQDISSWDVSQVTSMLQTFHGASSFNQALPWDTSSVRDMTALFRFASSFNGDVSSFVTSRVTTMQVMFQGTAFNGDVSNFDTSKVTTMRAMFASSSFNRDVSSFDTSSVIDMAIMFSGASSFNQGLSSWDTSSATDMSFMFSSASAFNQDVSSFDTSSVSDMSGMFLGASLFNQNLCAWGSFYSVARDYGSMFINTNCPSELNPSGPNANWCVALCLQSFADKAQLQTAVNACASPSTQTGAACESAKSMYGWPMGTWQVGAVTDMSNLFAGKADFNEDISSWDVSQVTTMNAMFDAASSFNGDLPWDTSSVTSMTKMFDGATAFNGDVSGFDVSQVTNMFNVFFEAASFNKDISSWDVSQVTSMVQTFHGASSFNQALPWDTSSVRDMTGMFRFASSFNGDVSSFVTSRVTTMQVMFQGTAFNGDVSNFDTSKVTNMRAMFSSASAFNRDVSSFDTSSVVDMNGMFLGASLFNQNLCAWGSFYSVARDYGFMFINTNCPSELNPSGPNANWCRATCP